MKQKAQKSKIHILEDPQVTEQLDELIGRFAFRQTILGSCSYSGWQAGELASALAGRTSTLDSPQHAVRLVLTGLYNDDAPEEFWRTPLGRVCAFWGDGLIQSGLTRGAAANALGCTRQNVALMLRSGRLSEPTWAVAGDSVSVSSLAHAMRLKHPLMSV